MAFPPFPVLEKLYDGFFTEMEFDNYSVHGSIVPKVKFSKNSESWGPIEPKLQTRLLDQEPEAKRTKIMETTDPISSLSVEEHRRYLELSEKRKMARLRGFPIMYLLSGEENGEYEKLDKLVLKEKSSYYELYRRRCAEKYSDQMQYLDDRMVAELAKYYRLQLGHLKKLGYPKYYELASTFRVKDTRLLEDQTMVFVRTELRLGLCQQLKSARNINVDKALEKPLYNRVAAISEDMNVKKLMSKHKFDAAMSSSTIIALFCTIYPACRDKWTIPVKLIDANGMKQLVFDKPLPKETLSTREAYTKFCSKVVKRSAVDTTLPAIDIHRNEKVDEVQENRICQGFSYHAWKLGEYQILVRCKERSALSSTGDKLNLVGTKCNLDFRRNNEKESICIEQVAHWWLHTWLRGNSSLHVTTVKPDSYELLETKPYSLEDLLAMNHTLLDTQLQFGGVHNLIQTLLDFPMGNYMVQHEMNRPTIRIFKGIENEESRDQKGLDLEQFYNTCHVVQNSFDYVLPVWNLRGYIPYTFAPATYCPSFFDTGTCSIMANNHRCPNYHIRRNIKNLFEFHLYKPAGGAGKVLQEKPSTTLHPTFKYCQAFTKNSPCFAKCKYPHLPMSSILEKLATTLHQNKRCKKSIKR